MLSLSSRRTVTVALSPLREVSSCRSFSHSGLDAHAVPRTSTLDNPATPLTYASAEPRFSRSDFRVVASRSTLRGALYRHSVAPAAPASTSNVSAANIRIALRMEDLRPARVTAETAAAAGRPRDQPGRADEAADRSVTAAR